MPEPLQSNEAPDESAIINHDGIDVAVIETRLPCRSFRINYKVAEGGDFSLTTEFILKLLRLVDDLPETVVSEFFGFNSDETRFVVNFVENQGYARRENGKVYLTQAGHRLFINSEEPALFEVYSKEERFDFDLISLAPADPFKYVDDFELRFPELPLPPSSDASTSIKLFEAFKRYFQEFRIKRGSPRLEKEILYTVDLVRPEQRFSISVPIALSIRPDEPQNLVVDLTHWRSGTELEDRAAVVASCAEFIREAKEKDSRAISQALNLLLNAAPSLLSGFHKMGDFNVKSFIRATARQAGDLRADRQTVRMVGQLWTEANRVRFATALKYASERADRKAPTVQFWLRPSTPHWGATKRLPEMLAAVTRQLSDAAGEERSTAIRSVLIGDEGRQSRFRHAFDCVVSLPPADIPHGLEIFLVPGHVTFVAVNISLEEEGFPIPVGILSFDKEVVARVEVIFRRILSSRNCKTQHCLWKGNEIVEELRAVLGPEA